MRGSAVTRVEPCGRARVCTRKEIIRPWGGPLAEFGRAVGSQRGVQTAGTRRSAAMLRSGQIFLQGTISALTSHCCTLFTFAPCKNAPPGSHKFHLFDCSALGRQHDHVANLWQSTLHFHSESAAFGLVSAASLQL